MGQPELIVKAIRQRYRDASFQSVWVNPGLQKEIPAGMLCEWIGISFSWKKLQSCFAIFECVFSVVPEHRGQHSPQVRHTVVDASGSRRKQIRLDASASRFVAGSYRERHLSQHGHRLEKQSGLFFPSRFILAPKPLEDLLYVSSACGVHHVDPGYGAIIIPPKPSVYDVASGWYREHPFPPELSTSPTHRHGEDRPAGRFGSTPIGIGEVPHRSSEPIACSMVRGV
jgi:hypothetical protein